MNRTIVIGVLLVLQVLAGCSAPEPTPAAPESPTVTPTQAESSGITLSRDVPRISPEDLKAKLDSGQDIVVGDTRGESSYAREHIPGAISITSSSDDALNELALDQEIILYCA
jgi:hypothetical protein